MHPHILQRILSSGPPRLPVMKGDLTRLVSG
jgi:hypothetical protein